MRVVLLLLLVSTATTAQVQQQPIYGNINGEIIRETAHFQIYAEHSYVPVDLDWLQTEIETIHAYLTERLGVSTTERFALTFRPPDTAPCPIRGLARFDEPVAQSIVFADPKLSRAQLSGILAHEIAHLFHARVLQAGTADVNLGEGFATWAAGKYWQAWQGTPADNVRTFRREGRYIALEEYYRETRPDTNSADCLRNRDRRYNSWAAFIDFLIADYGFEKFRQLLGSKEELREVKPTIPNIIFIDPATFRENAIVLDPTMIVGGAPVADFKGVYGLSLSELEKAWLAKLN